VTLVSLMAYGYWYCIGRMLGALLEPLRSEAKAIAYVAVFAFVAWEVWQ